MAHTQKQILDDIKQSFDNVPEEAEIHLKEFIQDLLNRGLAGYELAKT